MSDISKYIRDYSENNNYSLQSTNCMHFVFNFIDEKHGTNFKRFLEPIKKHKQIRGVYRKHGYKNIVLFMNDHFKRINKKIAKKGDIGYHNGYLALKDGLFYFMFTNEGVTAIQSDYIRRAWTWEM